MAHLSIGRGVIHIGLAFFLAVTVVARQGPSQSRQTTKDEPAILDFKEFFETSTRGLRPTQKLINLKNRRVKLVGFMAQMENELEGSFFLVPRPVFCDEEGGGNADIPPEAVLVIVPFRSHEKIPFVPGLLEVTGVLEIGHKEEKRQLSSIRLIMDGPTEDSHQPPRARKTSNN